ncbi:BatA domain-containing protein [Candidatus Woesearchaeota archaeon]|nr:BatA domain-containing protein [Candidatus Woesearchaeota archaeon]
MVAVGPLNFGNLFGLYALLTIVPLILLYLIRPKPKMMTIPSLMFFLKMSGANRITSFFKQLTRDWLLFIQLLILLLLALAFTEPFTYYTHDVSSANTIIVLDVSASMQAKEGSLTRFEKAKSFAKELLGASNTIVLAKYYSEVGVQDVSRSDAVKYLNTLQPYESPTRLGDAILTAGGILEKKGTSEGRIIVISDFLNTEGQDATTTRAVLQSKNMLIDFINVAEQGEKENVGFIDLFIDRDSTTAYIKNFAGKEKTITLTVGNLTKNINMAAKAVEPFSFQTVGGVTKLQITPFDEFPVDNELFVSAPKTLKVPVQFISNDKSEFLYQALEASRIAQVDVAEPPIVPKGGYQIFILNNVDPREILTGTMEELSREVENGASIIITAQKNMNEIDYSPILPLTSKGLGKAKDLLIQQINRFTKNIEFGSVKEFIQLSEEHGLTPIISADSDVIVGLAKKGSGKILYYGILESANEFHFSPGYPIFWTEIIKFLTEKQDLESLNDRTKNTIFPGVKMPVDSPRGRLPPAPAVFLENQGLYHLGDVTIAVNLLNEQESEVSVLEKGEYELTPKSYELMPVEEKRKFEIDMILIILGSLILFFELVYVKQRGDF